MENVVIVGIQGFFAFKNVEKNINIKIMTEENFFDMFNRIHNPDYYYAKKKTKQKKIEKKNKKQKNDPPKFKIFRV